MTEIQKVSGEQAAAEIIRLCLQSGLFSHVPIRSLPFEEKNSIVTKTSSLGAAVYGSQCGAEYGIPPALSLSYVVPVQTLDQAGMFFCSGNEKIEQGSRGSYLQIILLRSSGERDISRLLRKRSLVGELPGYMARSRGTETSVKIHRDLINEGFSIMHCAAAAAELYHKIGYAFDDMTIISGMSCDDAIALLRAPVCAFSASIDNERERDIAKIIDDCTKQTDCVVCDDKPVCDSIRQML